MALSGFDKKLTLYQRNLSTRDFFLFASSQQLDSRSGSAIKNADIDAYCKHLQELKADMKVRFQNVFQLEVPNFPFCDISENGILEEELITLKSDHELKPKFKILYQSSWLQNEIKERYLHMWDRVKLFLNSKKSRFEIVNSRDLRLFLSKLKPDIDKLITKHQPHPSH